MKRLMSLVVVVLLGAVMFSSVNADAPIEGREGRAELRFLEGMMDHHQMALDMANDCLAESTSEEVKALCQNIIDAQTAEIATMKEWTLAWYNVDYAPMSMTDMDMGEMEGMDHSGMPGMPATDPVMMMGMMAGLNRLEGVDYDFAWLESMIDHHDDAIHMSKRLLMRVPEGVGHADLFALANQIIADQTAETSIMEEMLTVMAS